MAEQQQPKHVREVLRDMPNNWGRWGKDDEIGRASCRERV